MGSRAEAGISGTETEWHVIGTSGGNDELRPGRQLEELGGPDWQGRSFAYGNAVGDVYIAL
jgi:hypothetical protein